MSNELQLSAGAAAREITPETSQFLFGYPHVERYSTGVHDPLFASALYLDDGATKVLFIANDIIFVNKELTRRIRDGIQEQTGVPGENILVSATHTHSGPLTVDHLSNEGDPLVPKADPEYLKLFVDRAVEAGVAAVHSAATALVGLVTADGSPVGTNRRDPSGPKDAEVPVLYVRDPNTGRYRCLMMVCSMHPTVMHEDSTLVSGDFPGMTRRYLQENLVGPDCPVVYHTGPAGNQSPRHVTRGNTFEEAERLGSDLGRNVEAALAGAGPAAPADRETTGAAGDPHSGTTRDTGSMRAGGTNETRPTISVVTRAIDLPIKSFPAVETARGGVEAARRLYQDLKGRNAAPQEVRTAECDVFGAEETLTLANAAVDGRVESYAARSMPAEIQVIRVGPWTFVGWPGELFVEYSLEVKKRAEQTYVISLANGETQGYIVTEEAAAEGGYEASNALFHPESGRLYVEETLEALAAL